MNLASVQKNDIELFFVRYSASDNNEVLRFSEFVQAFTPRGSEELAKMLEDRGANPPGY